MYHAYDQVHMHNTCTCTLYVLQGGLVHTYNALVHVHAHVHHVLSPPSLPRMWPHLPSHVPSRVVGNVVHMIT